jgi:hypothetical protein
VNYYYYYEPGIKAWTKGVPFEHEALQQVRRSASLPFIHKHVAVMLAQSDLVETVHTLKQVLCVKG